MSTGIYKLNGNYAYSLNLEKKQKRKKDIEIIEILDNATEEDLQNLLKKYQDSQSLKSEESENKLYKFINYKTKEIIISIYPNLDNITNINKEEWFQD